MVFMEPDMQYTDSIHTDMRINTSAVSGDQLDNTEGFDQDGQQKLDSFWNEIIEDIRKLTNKDFKEMELPIARIKRIMKLDEDVKMIAAETPVLFAKAAEIFIKDLTLRAWIMTEESKRRTLQRNDISAAAGKCEMFDFLIDVLPREDAKTTRRTQCHTMNTPSTSTAAYGQQGISQIDNTATLSIPATMGGGDQMQHIVIQLPASILSALSPQKQATQSGITIMQQMPLTISGAVPQQHQIALTADDQGTVSADGSQVFAISGGDLSGGTIQLSAAQLQSLLQPAALKQSMQPQQR